MQAKNGALQNFFHAQNLPRIRITYGRNRHGLACMPVAALARRQSLWQESRRQISKQSKEAP
jgi:hypothetical protein